MGNCIYCGQMAGLWRRKHKECAEKHEAGVCWLAREIKEAIAGGNYEGLKERLLSKARESWVEENELREIMVKAWEEAVEHFLEDGSLEEEEEGKLTSFAEHFGFNQDDLDKRGWYIRLVAGAVLRGVMEGKIPRRVSTDVPLPFNFQKKESLVWVFPRVEYYEEKTKRHYVGGSQGVSIRIASGVYYRIGGFKGHPVETQEMVHVDTGILALTDKHIYFGGAKKSFRLLYSKIVSIRSYRDGIGVQKDAASARPQVFVNGDGWFLYNLAVNLTGRE